MQNPPHKVVVITGASSGLGRVTAHKFAEAGYAVCVTARREAELERTALTCRKHGAEVLVVKADVTREADVRNLVDLTLARWGRIDVFVNNAGVTLFASLDEAPFEEHKRVIETNLYGSMHGARAVIPIFRRQAAGVLINVGSVLGEVGQAFVPSYVISKFALRGMSEALRVDLADEPDIHVCTIFPYTIDTPHFQSGANDMGRKAYAMPPMQSPEKVADAIVHLASHPHRERHVPRIAFLGLALHYLRPRSIERLLLHALKKWHLGGEQKRSQGNLYVPDGEEAHAHGRRTPRVGGSHFALWAVREYAGIEFESALRTVRGWMPRAQA